MEKYKEELTALDNSCIEKYLGDSVRCSEGMAVGSQEGSSVTYSPDKDLFDSTEAIASVGMDTLPSSAEVPLT